MGLTHLHNSGIGNRIRWGLHDVSMARLYLHKTALPIERRRARFSLEKSKFKKLLKSGVSVPTQCSGHPQTKEGVYLDT